MASCITRSSARSVMKLSLLSLPMLCQPMSALGRERSAGLQRSGGSGGDTFDHVCGVSTHC